MILICYIYISIYLEREIQMALTNAKQYRRKMKMVGKTCYTANISYLLVHVIYLIFFIISKYTALIIVDAAIIAIYLLFFLLIKKPVPIIQFSWRVNYYYPQKATGYLYKDYKTSTVLNQLRLLAILYKTLQFCVAGLLRFCFLLVNKLSRIKNQCNIFFNLLINRELQN